MVSAFLKREEKRSPLFPGLRSKAEVFGRRGRNEDGG